MLILTQKDRNRRLDELQRPDIDRLMKKAHKDGKGSSAQYQLYRRYGIEGDFGYQGGDWGHEPRRSGDEQ